jgi:hypothetical protein
MECLTTDVTTDLKRRQRGGVLRAKVTFGAFSGENGGGSIDSERVPY